MVVEASCWVVCGWKVGIQCNRNVCETCVSVCIFRRRHADLCEVPCRNSLRSFMEADDGLAVLYMTSDGRSLTFTMLMDLI